MARSEAQKNADARYKAKSKQKIMGVSLYKQEINEIDKFIELHKEEISKARFVAWACLYFIERGELPPPFEVVPTANDMDGESGEDEEDSTNTESGNK